MFSDKVDDDRGLRKALLGEELMSSAVGCGPECKCKCIFRQHPGLATDAMMASAFFSF
jgi:hypothetical protein